MIDKLMDIIICPSCRKDNLVLSVFERDAHARVQNGMLTCADCDMWFKIEDQVVDLLPVASREVDKYQSFAKKWNLEFKR